MYISVCLFIPLALNFNLLIELVTHGNEALGNIIRIKVWSVNANANTNTSTGISINIALTSIIRIKL
jgi:hypothetical protein